jgi:serine/threonine protein phosphatase PrpC
MNLRVGSATDVGRLRAINEDAFLVDAGRGFFVVCDGMGGQAAGEVASGLAVRAVAEALADAQPSAAADDDARFLPRTRRLAAAVRRANHAVHADAQRDQARLSMGTTLVSAWIGPDVTSLAHVGDSRAYLWHAGRLDALTTDHSLVEAQVQAGLLEREASSGAEHQNVLLRALGPEPEVDVELTEAVLEAGDCLVLCTDGLTRMVSEAAMAATLARVGDPQAMCDALIADALKNGGEDNVTVVVVQVVGSWWSRLRPWRR